MKFQVHPQVAYNFNGQGRSYLEDSAEQENNKQQYILFGGARKPFFIDSSRMLCSL
jgi:hypothetical protein